MKFNWTRRRIILLSIPPLLFALYVLIGFFGVPAYVRYALNSTITEQTYGQAKIDEVSFNPFTLTLRINNLQIVDREDNKVASIDHLRANLQVSTLWRSGFVLHKFYIEKPNANLIITEDGAFNLAQLIKPGQEQEQQGPMVAITTLKLVGGKIDYIDRSIPETFEHRVRDMNLTLNNFNLAPAARNPLHFTARTPAGEHITWDGSFSVDPFSSEGTIKIDPAKTPIYGPYYQRFSQFNINRGQLSMQARYRFLPMRSKPVIEIDADSIAVENLKVGDVGNEHEFYQVKRGEVSKMQIDLVGRKLTIHRIQAQQGGLTVRRAADGSLPIRQAFAETLSGDQSRNSAPPNARIQNPDKVSSGSPDQNGQAGLIKTLQQILERAQQQRWMVRLDEFAIEEHEIVWIDQSFDEPVELHVSKVNLTGGPVISEQQYAFPVKLAAQIDDSSSINLDGEVRPMTLNIDAAVRLQNFDLAQINPYLEKHTPLAISRGRVTLDGQAESALPTDQSIHLAYQGNAMLTDLHVAPMVEPDDQGEPSAQFGELTLSDLSISSQPWKIVLPTTQARTMVLRQGGEDQPSAKAGQATLTDLTVTSAPWRIDLVGSDLAKVTVHRGIPQQPVIRSEQVTLTSLSGDLSPLTGSLDRLTIAAVSLAESTDADPIFKAETVAVSEATVQDEPKQLQVKQISLEKPYLLAGLTPEGRFNIQQLLQAWRGDTDGRETTGDQADAQPAQMKLGRVQISEGSGNVFDRRMDEPMTIDIDQLEATLDNVTLQPGEHAQVKVTARINQDTNLQTEGSMEIGDPGRFTDLTIKSSALTMNQYQPYVERYLGYAVQNGQLELDATCKLQSRQLDIEVHLILSNFYLGRKVQSEHAVDAPIKLGLDLLRDRQGQVELTIPIQGNLAQPEFQFAHLISRAMGGVLAAIATAPFDILASIAAPTEKKLDLSFVSFPPGSAELSPQAADQLNVLEQALYKRPAVSLRVTGGLAPEADRLPLKRRKFVMKEVPGQVATDVETVADAPAIDPDAPAYRRVIRQHYRQIQDVESKEKPADQPNANRVEASFGQMEQAVLKGVEVEKQAFRDLARSRLRAVRQQLLESGRLATDQVVLGEPSTTATDQPRVIFEVIQI